MKIVLELLRSLPCWPIFVDKYCRDGLREAKKASGGASYSVIIDRYAQLANDSLTHRQRRRELKKAVGRGADINPNALKVEK
jgi:hypothetical protein